MEDENGIPPHSIAFVVEGGDPEAIAQAVAAKKTPGTGTFGDVAVELADKHGSTTAIRFFRPRIVPVKAHVHIRPLPGYVSTTAAGIAAVVVAAVNALTIGEDVLLSKLYTPINAAEPDPAIRTFDVLSITLGADGEPPAAANLEIAFNEAVAGRSVPHAAHGQGGGQRLGRNHLQPGGLCQAGHTTRGHQGQVLVEPERYAGACDRSWRALLWRRRRLNTPVARAGMCRRERCL